MIPALVSQILGIVGIFYAAALIHEFGHLFAYHHYLKFWPPLRIRWWGFEVGSKDLDKELTMKQDYWIRVWGIMAGYWAMLIMLLFSPFLADLMEYMLMYAIMCFFDAMAIAIVINNPDKRDWKYKEFKVTRVIEP